LCSLGIFLHIWEYFHPFGYIFARVGIFEPFLVYFYPFWYIFTRFGKFLPVLVYCYPFWYVVPRKIWQPCLYSLPEQALRVQPARLRHVHVHQQRIRHLRAKVFSGASYLHINVEIQIVGKVK
jgi:hypothetical protein